MSDAVVLHDTLNPALFDGEQLRPDVRAKLLEIAEEFIDYLGVSNLDVKDITISGSNAAYSYTPHSDIDLHIIADLSKFNNDEIYRELFTAKKNLFNADHNIKIKGYDVELYVQDNKKPVRSLGEYSVERNKWIKFPSKQRANLDHHTVENKFKKLVQLGQLAMRSTDMEALGDVLSTIKRYRQAGLDEHGEFGPENLAFKALRSQGIVDKLYNHMDVLKSRQLSLDEMMDEDYSTDNPPGPEFPPQFPAGTVKVDVSDVYDWYKLGQHISNLDDLGHHDFGQGPPSTVLAFGTEEEEEKYIKNLKKLGLKIHDIDPPGLKGDIDESRLFEEFQQFMSETRPTLVWLKGKLSGSYTDQQLKSLGAYIQNGQWVMPRDKYDAAVRDKKLFEASGYIPSEKERNDPRFKTALTVDVHPDSIQQNAKKLGSKIARSGVPPTLKASGKI